MTIVSGLPRSGTSLMMQMLQAGGIPALTDNLRAPDEDNPRGYLEFEPVKQIKDDPSWLDQAPGKAVKMVHLLLLELPLNREYRVVFMRRDLREVLASQKRMLLRQKKTGAQLGDAQLTKLFEDQVNKVLKWMREQPNFRVLEVNYRDLLSDPLPQVQRINEFMGGNLDEQAMIGAVDPNLYRNRAN